MAQEEQEQPYQRVRYMTPNEVIAYYQEKDTPLDGMVIFAALEPLAGTSFLSIATEALKDMRQKRHMFFYDDMKLYARHLNLAFYGSGGFDAFQEVKDGTARSQALAAFHSVTAYPIPLKEIWMYQPMQPDEMLVLEERFDEVFSDEAHTNEVFLHLAEQWRFYKGGQLIHVVPTSRIAYDYAQQGKTHVYSRLSEGYNDFPFFDSPQRIALPFVRPSLQAFHRSLRFLAVSPQFSFEAARRKT